MNTSTKTGELVELLQKVKMGEKATLGIPSGATLPAFRAQVERLLGKDPELSESCWKVARNPEGTMLIVTRGDNFEDLGKPQENAPAEQRIQTGSTRVIQKRHRKPPVSIYREAVDRAPSEIEQIKAEIERLQKRQIALEMFLRVATESNLREAFTEAS